MDQSGQLIESESDERELSHPGALQAALRGLAGKPLCRKPARGGLAPWQERRAKELINANIGGKISPVRLADACGLSRGHFTRAFKQTTGHPPHRWLLGRRIERACDLLTGSDMQLAEIAVTCGFADQSHFTRSFSRALGMTPRNWRRQHRR